MWNGVLLLIKKTFVFLYYKFVIISAKFIIITLLLINKSTNRNRSINFQSSSQKLIFFIDQIGFCSSAYEGCRPIKSLLWFEPLIFLNQVIFSYSEFFFRMYLKDAMHHTACVQQITASTICNRITWGMH